MPDLQNATLLSEEEVLATRPEYRHGRRPGRPPAKSTIFRHRKNGLLTPSGQRVFLRGIRLTGGFFYRPEDIDAFFAAINGEGEDGAAPAYAWKPAPKPSPLSGHADPVEAAEAELAAAGIA